MFTLPINRPINTIIQSFLSAADSSGKKTNKTKLRTPIHSINQSTNQKDYFMHLKIKPFNPDVRDRYEHHGHFHDSDAGIDLFVIDEQTIKVRETAFIHLQNVCHNFSFTAYLFAIFFDAKKTAAKETVAVRKFKGSTAFFGNELNSSAGWRTQTVIHSYPHNSLNLLMNFFKATNKTKLRTPIHSINQSTNQPIKKIILCT